MRPRPDSGAGPPSTTQPLPPSGVLASVDPHIAKQRLTARAAVAGARGWGIACTQRQTVASCAKLQL